MNEPKSFRVVDPNSEAGRVFDELLNTASARFDYDGLIEAFNASPVGHIINFEYPPASMTNFSAMLKNRGLGKNVDFVAKGQTLASGEYWITLKRLTDVVGKKLEQITEERPRRKKV